MLKELLIFGLIFAVLIGLPFFGKLYEKYVKSRNQTPSENLHSRKEPSQSKSDFHDASIGNLTPGSHAPKGQRK
jgi:Na+/glutamate symporter